MQRERCRVGLKSVGRTCVRAQGQTVMPISDALSWDLGYAAQAIRTLPQRIREVKEAADAVIQHKP